MKTIKLTEDTRKDILDRLLKRSPDNYSEYEKTVADIITDVRTNGARAVFSYTKKFDQWESHADNIPVTQAEIEEAERLRIPVRRMDVAEGLVPERCLDVTLCG